MKKSLPHIVYLHGFLSGPASSKARDTAAWMEKKGLADHFHCPQWRPVRHHVETQLRQVLDPLRSQPVCIVGSSMGGFYATWAAEEYGARLVLINPAVRPYRFLQDYLGIQHNYLTGEEELIEADFAEELLGMERSLSEPEKAWLLVQTGDKTLDYRDAVKFYAGCRQTIIEGGNHSFDDYAQLLPHIWDFALER